MEIEGLTGGARGVSFGRVAANFFATAGARVVAGRDFQEGDTATASTHILVNRTFVQEYLGGGNVLGKRVRYASTARWVDPGAVELDRWYEIVGVVSDVPARAAEPGRTNARMYHAVAPGQLYPVNLSIRVQGLAPSMLAQPVRQMAARLDPTLRLSDVVPMNEIYRQEQIGMRLQAWALALVTLSVLLLSAAGIYAMVSFAIAQRRREIGIRAALGADPRSLLWSMLSRVIGQLSIAVLFGLVAAVQIEISSGGGLMDGKGLVALPVMALLMLTVGLLATIGPARRGLRIDPTEALRQE